MRNTEDRDPAVCPSSEAHELALECLKIMEYGLVNVQGFKMLAEGSFDEQVLLAELCCAPIYSARHARLLFDSLIPPRSLLKSDGAVYRPKLIVFDKDGTLVNFGAAYGDW